MNNDIKEYTTPSGEKRYKFLIYVGRDETTGRTIQIKKQGFRTQDGALESYLKYRLKVVKGEYTPVNKKNLTFKQLFEMWLKSYRATVKESTYATTLRYFNDHILKSLGTILISKLTVLNCQQAVNEWFTKAPRTYKRFVRYVNNVLDYGVDLELIAKNPMRKVIRPKVPKTKKPFTDFYSKDELNVFLRDAKEYNFRYFIFFRLLAYSGMRKGEALALKWSDINFKDNTISITKSVTQGLNNRLYLSNGKTINSIRMLDMDTQTMEYLKQWRTAQQKQMFKLGFNFLSQDNFIFPTVNNEITQPSKPTQWNNAICKKYGLRHIKVHGFRHTHASLLFEAGVSMQNVKERLGHANIETTMNIYTHVTKKQKEETANQFASYMEN
ncbi:site-specific integrase [Lactobacillus kefiranofaciens subsp. kefirgranum]|uniref:tyrosine-type recombinase/integrase n=1 Tax=Lactobacillus kefiranofaciens TaxID=267818 RepID=UPI0006CF3BE2|nr:site-specific integrase [Lactobacillus kefiranofaciens]KRL28992.1 bacteriophage integrase [Lactobacillus kefiranofaciens subsp. kefirgranum DSM 10550 = JCM 8572]